MLLVLGIGLVALAVSVYLIYRDIDDIKYRMGHIENDISRMRKWVYNVIDKLPNSYNTGKGCDYDSDEFYRIRNLASSLLAVYSFCPSVIKV